MSKYDSVYGICPYCEHKYGDMWELLREDGESETVICDKCERKFVVTLSIDVTYTSDFPDDERESDEA